ncbi:hypothetical protein EA772_10295 [Pedobacter sp. G11]|uniref:hypothetical protein n=1 Tax=Pedobacter sp. G11 TaxID=2482728 RepID=UPI000F5F4E29|nr:hypothetical protein [Pedobacter sp. G11]AZI25716.1 hypothetical protein EA772_10295 [Pedobacter sp. G11]
MKKYLYLLMVTTALISCKKKTLTPEPEPQPVPAEVFELNKSTGIPASKFSMHFREDFVDNRNAWTLQAPSPNYSHTVAITDGFYTFTNPVVNTINGTTDKISFDQTKDWEIETKVNNESKSFAFWWNSAPGRQSSRILFGTNRMDFVDANNEFNGGYIVLGKNVEILTQNTLKIRRVKDRYYIFLNGNLVYEGQYIFHRGQNIGYYSFEKGKMQVDYLQISYINI